MMIPLRDAEKFAESVLNQYAPGSRAPAQAHSVWYGDRHYYNPVCYCYIDHSRGSHNGKDPLGRIFLSLVGIAVIGVTSWFLGRETGQLNKLSVERLRAHDNQTIQPSPVFDFQIQMIDRMRSSAQWGVAAKVALIASTLLAVGGLIGACPAAAVTGVALAAIASLDLLYRCGYRNADTRPMEDAYQLLRMVHDARQKITIAVAEEAV